MKTLLLVLFLTGAVIFNAYAQKKAAAASTSSAPTGSGATQLIQGYHYKLKAYQHLKYIEIKKGKQPEVKLDPAGKPKTTPVNTTDYVIKFDTLVKGGPIPKNAIVDGKFIIINLSAANIRGSMLPDAREAPRDTLWRYSTQNLRISVTQGDSGKLSIQFLNVHGVKRQENFIGIDPKLDTSKIRFAYYKDHTTLPAIPIMETDSAANFFF